jgi:RNA polymerase sigma-70 factor (ECF subfamily)
MNAVSTTEREELTQILIEAGQGSQRAFAELYKRTSAKLFGVCVRMLRDRGEAEEVLQEVFTTVWRRADSFDPGRASAITWLVTMARNKAIDRLRQHREERLPDADHFDIEDEHEPGPASEAEQSQERQRLERCIDGLEPEQKSAIREAFFSGATYNELAARCRVPLGTMKSWIRRSLIRLRMCLEQ